MDFHANGKLMLFGEYLVLKGSKCLAIPLKYNQIAEITKSNTTFHNWVSLESGKEWFSARFNGNFDIQQSSDPQKAEVIQCILQTIFHENQSLFGEKLSFKIHSNFPREWGLGSSSSLISLLSQWSQVDPYELLEKSFGGSGYDIASAIASKPILYEIKGRKVQEMELDESITSKLLFVYTGKKQSSKKEIKRFQNFEIPNIAIDEMNGIISQLMNSKNIEDFENCMRKSETLIGSIIQAEKIKNKIFPDYGFSIKSLGAWGGDFFMASFRDEKQARQYFQNKGFPIQFTYSELIYHK